MNFFSNALMLFWTPPPPLCLFIIIYLLLYLIFLVTFTEIDDLNIHIPISTFQQLNMRKTCEKDPCISSTVQWRYILFIFEVHILFFLVYIRFLTFTVNYIIFGFSITPFYLRPSFLIRYPENQKFPAHAIIKTPSFIWHSR